MPAWCFLTLLRAAGIAARIFDQKILSSPEGFLLRARRVDHSRLAPLRGSLKQGAGTFDLNSFRKQAHEPSLRD